MKARKTRAARAGGKQSAKISQKSRPSAMAQNQLKHGSSNFKLLDQLESDSVRTSKVMRKQNRKLVVKLTRNSEGGGCRVGGG